MRTIAPTLLPKFIAPLVTALALGCAPAEDALVQPVVDPGSDEVHAGFDPNGKADGDTSKLPAYAPLPARADLSQPFEALFAPDDPVVSVELALIQEVIDARQAAAGTFDEGENPFSIRYAVYNLRNPVVAEKLIEAHQIGVDVQVLLEADQLDPDRTWNTMDELLIEAGFEFVASHTELTASTRITADLIGITGSSLMHLKSRIFATPNGKAVISGSMNPGDNAVYNEETLHLIRDPAVVARYEEGYEAVRSGQLMPNRWDSSAAVNVLFTPSQDLRAGTRVLEWIQEEDEQILLMVFSLRDLTAPGVSRSLVELLGDKVAQGVPVYVITDRKQADGVDANGQKITWDDTTDDKLRAVGVHVYEATNLATPYTAMHHKVAVLGRTHVRVITDAANWTRAGLGSDKKRARNHESVLFIDSQALDQGRTGRRYLNQWLRVLSRYAWQSVEKDGELEFEVVRDHLMGQPDWPAQPVAFVAHEAETDWGETLGVTGSHAAIGSWGDGAPIQLQTDAQNYPTWWMASEVPSLPLGWRFEWKLVVLSDDDRIVGWQPGDNQTARAAPAALLHDDALILEATWR